MTVDGFALLDLGLAFGVLLALLVWELVSLRRSQRRDRNRARDEDSPHR
ncbi:MAG: hypothetical protein NTW01_04255 [Gammaproteobacteria bacterium]|jgi:hypothetical protein|nr:hypothetical protein [Gammaproteobacteria bacterium]